MHSCMAIHTVFLEIPQSSKLLIHHLKHLSVYYNYTILQVGELDKIPYMYVHVAAIDYQNGL